MTMNDDMKVMWDERAMAYFQKILQFYPGKTKEGNKKPLSRYVHHCTVHFVESFNQHSN